VTFVPTNPILERSATMASSTTSDFRAAWAMQDATQDAVNWVFETDGAEAAKAAILEAAALQLAAYPQYDGEFEPAGWELGRFDSDVRTKGGLRFAKGDVVVFKTRTGLGSVEVTAYSLRGAVHCRVAGGLRWWEPIL
jgi:hypothetical protein